MSAEAKIETKVEAAVPKNDKKSQGTLHPNYKEDVEFRQRWRSDDNFRAIACSKFQWTEDEARSIIVRKSGWVKEKPGYKPCCCGNDATDIFIILGSLLALYISYAVFFSILFFFWRYAGDVALYVFLVLMACYWTSVGLLVYFGAIRIEKETQIEIAKEEEEARLAKEARDNKRTA